MPKNKVVIWDKIIFVSELLLWQTAREGWQGGEREWIFAPEEEFWLKQPSFPTSFINNWTFKFQRWFEYVEKTLKWKKRTYLT